jgi:hypothetical protein
MSDTRFVKSRRGSPPFQIHSMKSKDEFEKAWDRRMHGWNRSTKYDTGVWGMLDCDELYVKLTEMSNSKVLSDLSNYRAWYEHFFLR